MIEMCNWTDEKSGDFKQTGVLDRTAEFPDLVEVYLKVL